MVAAIDLIQSWIQTAGGIDQAINENILFRSAIERQLLIISEAAARLQKLDLNAGHTLAPDVDWAGIRGIGNFIRHKYDGLDSRIVVDVLRNRLTPLRAAVKTALTKLQQNES